MNSIINTQVVIVGVIQVELPARYSFQKKEFNQLLSKKRAFHASTLVNP